MHFLSIMSDYNKAVTLSLFLVQTFRDTLYIHPHLASARSYPHLSINAWVSLVAKALHIVSKKGEVLKVILTSLKVVSTGPEREKHIGLQG